MAQEWGSQPEHFLGESKKVFTNFLIWDIKIIQTQIFLEHRPIRAVRSLMGLINTLDGKSQKALATQYKELQEFTQNTSLVTSDKIYTIFSQLLAYLHVTYLKEASYARPMRPSKGFTEVPKF